MRSSLTSSFPFLAGSPAPPSGIARLARNGEPLRQGNAIEYFSLATRSMLNRCRSRRVPFAWTINPYRGCEFACKYCYARYTHEFMGMNDGAQFERKIYVKQHAAQLLAQELAQVRPGEDIAIGTATDPYQPAERNFEVTRSLLEELARHRGLELGLVTKSNLILRDLELLQSVARHNRLYVNLTITTLDAPLARLLEPRAPRPDLRLEAVAQLNRAGIAAGVSCAPVLPDITDGESDLEDLVRATAGAGGRHIFAGCLFLQSSTAAVFLPFVEENFPQLAGRYRARFRNRAFLPPAYRRRLQDLMARLRAKYGMGPRPHSSAELHPAVRETAQMNLF